MRRTPSCEQLLQSSLLERLVGADRNAIAPTPNLLHGELMTGGRRAHLNLEFGSQAIASAQPLALSAETPKAAAS